MIFRSPYPDVVIPDISVVDYVLQRAPEFGEKAALIDGVTGTTLSYDELASGIRRAAGGLAQRGLAKGDVLAIYSPNTLYYPVAFHGAAYAGGVVTTVNPLYTSGELAKQLRDARARFLITAGPFVDKAREAAAEAGGIEKIFTFDGAAAGQTVFHYHAHLIPRSPGSSLSLHPRVPGKDEELEALAARIRQAVH